MDDRGNKPVVENVRAKPSTKLIKVLKVVGRFLNPLPRTEGMGLAEMKQNIEGIKKGLGLKPRK